MLYRSALRAELTALAQGRWTPVDDNGIAEIQGVPRCSSRPGRRVAHEVESLGAELVRRAASQSSVASSPVVSGRAVSSSPPIAGRARSSEARPRRSPWSAGWREEPRPGGQATGALGFPRVLGQARTSTPRGSAKALVHLRPSPARGDARHLGTPRTSPRCSLRFVTGANARRASHPPSNRPRRGSCRPPGSARLLAPRPARAAPRALRRPRPECEPRSRAPRGDALNTTEAHAVKRGTPSLTPGEGTKRPKSASVPEPTAGVGASGSCRRRSARALRRAG